MKDHVALILKDKDKILFIKRSLQKRILPGAWAFPSGTREENEELYQTAAREAIEELGVEIEIEKLWQKKNFQNSTTNYTLFYVI